MGHAPPLCPLREQGVGERAGQTGTPKGRPGRQGCRQGRKPSHDDARLPQPGAQAPDARRLVHTARPRPRSPEVPSSRLSSGQTPTSPCSRHLPGRRTRTPTGHRLAAAPWGPGQTPSHLCPLRAPARLSPKEPLAVRPDDGPRALLAPTPPLRPLSGHWASTYPAQGPLRRNWPTRGVVTRPTGQGGDPGERPLQSCWGTTPGSGAEAPGARSPRSLPHATRGGRAARRGHLSARATQAIAPAKREARRWHLAPRHGCPPHA